MTGLGYTIASATAGTTAGTFAAGDDSRLIAYGSDLLDVGQETCHRANFTNTAVAQASGTIRLAFFTARKSETSTQVRVLTGGTAAAATPTLCRIGLWLVDSSSNGTLVASTANDTTLFSATVTAYTRPWSNSYAIVAGQRYALGILVISGAATPTFGGESAAVSSEWAVAPRRSGALTGQSDLGNFLVGSLATSGTRPYGVVLP